MDGGLAREPVHQRQLRRAGVAEHDADALVLQDLEKGLLAGDERHEIPPRSGSPRHDDKPPPSLIPGGAAGTLSVCQPPSPPCFAPRAASRPTSLPSGSCDRRGPDRPTNRPSGAGTAASAPARTPTRTPAS